MQRLRYPSWWLLVPILLIAALIAVMQLNQDALWFDEWITYFITGGGTYQPRSLPDLLYWAAIDNSWPPAFFLLLRLWDAGGGHYYYDRVLALLIGLLAISIQYRLIYAIAGRKSGLLAAALLASNAFFLWYMHEIRGYTLYVLFAALTGWLYWLLLDDRHRERRAIRWGFALSVAATLYTHYIGIALIFAIFLYHIIFERPQQLFGTVTDEEKAKRARFLSIFRLWFNGCLLFAPWIAVLIISFINESMTNRSLPTLELLQAMVYGFSNNLWWIALPAIAWSAALWRDRGMRFLWVWGLSVLAVSIAGNIFADFLFHPRHILALLPAWIGLISVGLLQSDRWHWMAYLLGGIWIGAGILAASSDTFMDALPRQVGTPPLHGMQTLVSAAQQCTRETDLLVVSIDTLENEWVHDQPILYYLGRSEATLTSLNYVVSDDYRVGQSALIPDDLEISTYSERLDAYTATAERVWVASFPELQVDGALESLEQALLDRGYTDCGTWMDTDDVVGWAYIRGDRGQCQQVLACSGE